MHNNSTRQKRASLLKSSHVLVLHSWLNICQHSISSAGSTFFRHQRPAVQQQQHQHSDVASLVYDQNGLTDDLFHRKSNAPRLQHVRDDLDGRGRLHAAEKQGSLCACLAKLRTAASQDLPKLSHAAGRAVGRMLRNLREVCRHRASAA